METLAIKTGKRIDSKRLTKLPKQNHKVKEVKELSDEEFIARIPDSFLLSRISKMMCAEDIDQIEIVEALYNCKNRADLEELYEDLVLALMIKEAMKEPSVSEDEIMEALRR